MDHQYAKSIHWRLPPEPAMAFGKVTDITMVWKIPKLFKWGRNQKWSGITSDGIRSATLRVSYCVPMWVSISRKPGTAQSTQHQRTSHITMLLFDMLLLGYGAIDINMHRNELVTTNHLVGPYCGGCCKIQPFMETFATTTDLLVANTHRIVTIYPPM